jgi:hypothetical protein
MVSRAPLVLSTAKVVNRSLSITSRLKLNAIKLGDLPHITIPPVPPVRDPVPAESVLLWPDPGASQAFFIGKTPEVLEMSLTVERTVRDGTIWTSGGNAVLVVATLPQLSQEALAQQYEAWTNALEIAGYGKPNWRFLPLPLVGLTASVDLQEAHARSLPRVTCSTQIGTATILLDLSETGVAVWRQAIETQRPETIPGLCNLTASFYGQVNSQKVQLEHQNLSAPLGNLVREAGPSILQNVGPEMAVEAVLVVDGHPTIENAVVSLRSPSGETHTQVVGPEGGRVSLRLASENPSMERVEWTARLTFQSPAWPVVSAAGTLSSEQGWVDIINPSSWVRNISLMTILLDGNGEVVGNGAPAAVDPANRVMCALDFSGTFLGSGSALHASFETSSQELLNLVIPSPPGVATDDVELKLTVFSMRGGRDEMRVRQIARDEQWIVIRVYPNARIEISTNRTPSTEAEQASDVSALFEGVSRAAETDQAAPSGPRIHAPLHVRADGPAPRFSVQPGQNRYWIIEIAARPALLMPEHASERTPQTFWSSDGLGFGSGTELTLSQPVWCELRSAARLYYRAWTSASPDGWMNPQVSLPDGLTDEAPFMEIAAEGN